jgi:hypothetical protein
VHHRGARLEFVNMLDGAIAAVVVVVVVIGRPADDDPLGLSPDDGDDLPHSGTRGIIVVEDHELPDAVGVHELTLCKKSPTPAPVWDRKCPTE